MKPQTLETIGALSGAFVGTVIGFAVTPRDPLKILFAASVGAGIGGGIMAYLNEFDEKNNTPAPSPENV